MPDTSYPVIDGASVAFRIRGEDLGTDSGVPLIGHKVFSDTLGATADAAAIDETTTASMVAISKAMLRELIAIAAGSGGGGGGSTYTEGKTSSAATVTDAVSTVVTVDCRGRSRMTLTIENAGANPLVSFNSLVRGHSDLTTHEAGVNYENGYTADSSATNGNATLLCRKSRTNFNPFTLAAGATTWIRFNVEGVESMQFTATVGSGLSTTMNAWWILE